MSVVSPQRPLLYLKDRLRRRLVEVELVDDPSLLELLSDAYTDACEASRCLQLLYDLPLTTATEYPLPADWVETLGVAIAGQAIQPIALRDSMIDRGVGSATRYYQYAKTIGFSPAPTGGTARILYVQSPPVLTTWEDTLDTRFPLPYLYVLCHYVRWRVTMMAGGAQKISLAQQERAWYDAGIDRLRRQGRILGEAGPVRIRSSREGVIRAS